MTNPDEQTRSTPDLASEEREREALLEMLEGQRSAVRAVLDGLPESALRRSVVPSGWTPLGLVEHLSGAEFFWFQVVATGAVTDQPAVADESAEAEAEAAQSEAPAEESEGWRPDRPFETDSPVEEIFAEYAEVCEVSNGVIRGNSLSMPPRFVPAWKSAAVVPDLRSIVLHLIEETARHAGHLDIARELLDGRTGLGGR